MRPPQQAIVHSPYIPGATSTGRGSSSPSLTGASQIGWMVSVVIRVCSHSGRFFWSKNALVGQQRGDPFDRIVCASSARAASISHARRICRGERDETAARTSLAVLASISGHSSRRSAISFGTLVRSKNSIVGSRYGRIRSPTKLARPRRVIGTDGAARAIARRLDATEQGRTPSFTLSRWTCDGIRRAKFNYK